MIPSDHFVRFYNEVFKSLEEKGREHLEAYWHELGLLQRRELEERFRKGGLQACYDYWSQILEEEDCKGSVRLTEDFFEFDMERCPSLSKVQDNDATPSPHYCDHCPGWVDPVLRAAGLYPANDIISRTEPRCIIRVYTDPQKAAEFEKSSVLPIHVEA
ncbi:MAG: hypothetical protein GX230_07400 [Lentisphaerae bacterium]|jgi:hypothetical protein|nr:hypothetical protein [Lentisphaerota bacterium]